MGAGDLQYIYIHVDVHVHVNAPIHVNIHVHLHAPVHIMYAYMVMCIIFLYFIKHRLSKTCTRMEKKFETSIGQSRYLDQIL